MGTTLDGLTVAEAELSSTVTVTGLISGSVALTLLVLLTLVLL